MTPRKEKIDGPNRLDRWLRETREQHRGLLLFAMQDPGSSHKEGICGGRNLSIVATAVHRKRSTLRGWSTKRRWVERVVAHGTDAQAYAVALYRRLYMKDFGESDLPHVAAVVSLPMTTAIPDGMETEVQEAALGIVRKLLPPEPAPDIQAKVDRAVDKKREDALKTNREVRSLAVDALKAIRNGINAATDKKFAEENPHIVPVRVRLSDLGRIQDVLRDLDEEANRLENPEIAVTGAQLVDSVRVRIAKETGGDVYAAMRDDVAELAALLDAMAAPKLTGQDIEDERAVRTEAS